MSEQRPVKLWCNSCMSETRHEHVVRREQTWKDECVAEDGTADAVYVTAFHDLYACRGCDAVLLRTSAVAEGYEDDPAVTYLPAQVKRRRPEWVHLELPRDLRDLLGEVYKSLQTGSRRLAAMGTRAILDMVLDEAVGNHGSFKDRVEGMVTGGDLTPKDGEVVLTTLDLGHAASHRAYLPDETSLSEALDIVEALLYTRYVRPRVADRLKTVVPPRPPKPAKSPSTPSSKPPKSS